MVELTTDNLKDVVKEHDRVFVQYGASWCGNCRMIKPKIKKLAAVNENVHFIYVDAEKFPGSRELADVANLPTFATFKAGQRVDQFTGSKFEKVEGMFNEIANN